MAASIDNAGELRSALSDYLVYDDVDSRLNTFIGLAEARFNRELRVAEMLKIGFPTFSSESSDRNESYFDMAQDVLEFTSLVYTGAGTPYNELIYESPDILINGSKYGTVGRPKNWTLISPLSAGSDLPESTRPTILFSPSITVAANTTATPFTYYYYAEIPSLDGADDATSNWLIEQQPDLYLYAALAEAGTYLADSSRLAEFQGRAQSAMDGIIGRDRRLKNHPKRRIVPNGVTNDRAFRLF